MDTQRTLMNQSCVPAAISGRLWLYNATMGSTWVSKWIAEHIGVVDSPLINNFDFNETCHRWGVITATTEALSKLDSDQRKKGVILVQDAFTRYFDTPVFAALIELASKAGFQVYLAPYSPNGKPLQVQGFLDAFTRTARRTASRLQALAGYDIPLVGLEPAMTLVYRQEYTKISGLICPEVLLPQEWLVKALQPMPVSADVLPQAYRLLGHCTEKTNAASSAALWNEVFKSAGLALVTQPTGCCGMSGTYGHEARNLNVSRQIFNQSWARALQVQNDDEPLATGYSCRTQTMRFSHAKLRHPVMVLLDHYRAH